MAACLILLRHGESTANAAGLFTGALDVDLTSEGRAQSLRAGHLLRDRGPTVDVVLCSPLTRARKTARIVVAVLGSPPELVFDWRLTERSYGALTGRRKAEVMHEFGTARFVDWRRSVDHAPPPLNDDRLLSLRSQLALKGFPDEAVAATECLRDVIVRLRPLIEVAIIPRMSAGQTVLVVGHGNSLRALVALLDGLDDEQLRGLNIPSGQPLIYRIRGDGTPVAGSGQYLDPTSACAATFLLEQQGGT